MGIRVASLNVWALPANLARHEAVRMDAIAREIPRVAPDLLAFQEVWTDGSRDTLVAGARRAGLEPPFACEEAYCGCCMARVAEGEAEMLMNDGGIDQRQIDPGWVLTCQAVPKGRVRVEYPD